MAIAVPAMAAANTLATQTTLSAETRDQGGRTQATFSVAVTGEDGLPAGGAVVIEDAGKPLAGAALNSEGKAQVVLGLSAGNHSLRAVYQGDASHKASISATAEASAAATGAPDFGISVNPATLTLTAGQSGTVIASVTPVNASALSAPMFVTLSCSGLPDLSSCAFTPENVEIQPNATAAVTSSMVITTQAGSTRGMAVPPGTAGHNPVAWAILLPGALGLAGLAFSARRRRWLSRLSLIALVGLVATLGTTSCAARYNYYNHGPPYNLPTPAGTYTITVTGQSSNGVTATTHFTTLALTVK
jgi:hypothetical protein